MEICDAVDYKGAPANRSTTGGWLSAASILVVELCERLSSMAIGVNMVTYLDGTLHLPSATSSTIVTNWGGFSFLLSLFGGILADSFLGRYRTIAIFANIHMLGSCLLAISTVVPNLRPPSCNPSLSDNCKEANALQMTVFYLAIYTLAVGLGGIKCSVSGFGTDQFDQKDEKEKAQMAYFFNRFYFFISIGTLVAVTVFIYIQDRVARVWGYGSCTVVMLIAVVIFLSNTRRYRYKECLGSPIIQICQVLVAAIRKRSLKFPSNNAQQYLHETHSPESTISRTCQFRLNKFAENGRGPVYFHNIAMVVAAIVEIKRLKVAKSTSRVILPISAFLLVPQFVLAGAAEGFVYTGQIDFFLTESPKGMKAVSTSLFLTTIAFGFFVSSALVDIIRRVTQGRHNWLPANINHGRLDLFYGFIALLSSINLVFYLYCAKWFLRKKTQIDRSLTNDT